MDIRLDQSTIPFNVEYTLRCGQAFRWERLNGWWYGVVHEKVVKIKQLDDKLRYYSYPESVDLGGRRIIKKLDDDLPLILAQIGKDNEIRNAIQLFAGLRINRQEPWECLISYICATCKNIPAIKNMIFNLSLRFGRKMTFDNHSFYTFPRPSDLANTSLEELRKCKVGFRAERILETSKIIDDSKLELDDLKKMEYREAKHRLLSLPGVGEKVADCILLFSLDKLEAFPVDIWVKRAILEFYPGYFEASFVERALSKESISRSVYERINSFGRKYFGEYAGYAQEYLFLLSRNQNTQGTCKVHARERILEAFS
jgi:N-glycosylase/DNA lyase